MNARSLFPHLCLFLLVACTSTATQIRALESPNAKERATAASRLRTGDIHPRQAIPALVDLLGDRTEVRIDGSWNRWPWVDSDATDPGSEAAAALGSYGESAVDPLLTAYSSAKSDDVRHDALLALALTGSSRALPCLREGLEDRSWEVRARSAWGIGVLRDRGSFDVMRDRLRRDDRWEVRTEVARAFGLLVEPRAVEPLIAALDDPNWHVRRQGVWSLGHLHDDRADVALRDALGDERWEVRREAAWALGVLADPEAASVLEAASQDANRDVRDQAVWALSRIHPDRRKPVMTRSFAQHFDVPSSGVLEVRAETADLLLLGGDGNQVSVDVKIECFAEPCEPAVGQYELVYRNDQGVLTLRAPEGSGRPSQREVQVSGRRIVIDDDVTASVTVTVPRRTRLRVDLTIGDVELRDLGSGLEAHIGMGSVEGELYASSLARIALASNVGTVRLHGAGVENQTRKRGSGVGDGVEWTAGPGRGEVDVEVGVGSVELRLK